MRRVFAVGYCMVALCALALAGGCGSDESPTAAISSDSADGASAKNAAETRAETARKIAEAEREAFMNPVVEVVTNRGSFKLKLDRTRADKTVDNFLEYATSGFYTGTVFHQVENGFVVAAGGYTEDLRRKPTRVPIRNEAHNGVKNRRGTVAMVRSPSSIHSATSQFLINLTDNTSLDHQSTRTSRRYDLDGEETPPAGDEAQRYGYCVFGQVIEGWDIVEKIAETRVQKVQHLESVPIEPIVIKTVKRVR